MDILFLYEHEVRELESIYLLKNEMEYRGYSTSVAHISGVSHLSNVIFSSPTVIVTPWLYSDNEIKLIKEKFKNVKKIVNLRMEQLFCDYYREIGIGNITGYAKEAHHICWGEVTKKRLIEFGVDKNKAHLTGAIHTDFFRDEFEHFYKSKEELAKTFGLNKDKKWVLYISSFSFATFDEKERKMFEKKWGGKFDGVYDIFLESKNMTLKWIEELLKTNKDIEFIYRPHPSEKIMSDINNMKKKYKNFHIIERYSVRQWIVACEVIDTWQSTSIAEIYYAGKRCNIIRPIKLPSEIDMEICKNADYINSLDDFINIHSNDINESFPLKKETIESYYSYDKRIPSFIKVCDVIENVFKITENCNFDTINANLLNKCITWIKMLIQNYILKHSRKISKYFFFNKKIRNKIMNVEKYCLDIKDFINDTDSKTKVVITNYHNNK